MLLTRPLQVPLPLAEIIRPAHLIESVKLQKALGVDVVLASESFQHTGSFKFRAAYNVAATVPNKRIITASSGNFGQGLAFACQLLGKSCIVVMPNTSAAIKVEAVKNFGAQVDLIDVAAKSRKARVQELAANFPDAYVASAYDDELVISGNATLGAELAERCARAQAFLAPVGGGGLTAGILKGLRAKNCRTPLFGVEPAIANDAFRSLKEGRIVTNEAEPQTLADGVRTLSLGENNWRYLKTGLAGILEVTEDAIRESVKLLFLEANLKAEPTGALPIAALLEHAGRFSGKRVCCVISGGNVDPDLFADLVRTR